jgi:hypothetical protein
MQERHGGEIHVRGQARPAGLHVGGLDDGARRSITPASITAAAPSRALGPVRQREHAAEEQDADHAGLEAAEVVDRELLEARGDTARFLRPADAVLDDVAPPARRTVARRRAPRPGARRATWSRRSGMTARMP